MEFNINEPLPRKITDRAQLDGDKKHKKKKAKKNKANKSDDSKSQGTTEEEENTKNIILKKTEVEQVTKAQKNIQFWFD